MGVDGSTTGGLVILWIVFNSVALIKEGKIRALGITDKRRLETLPDIPTLDEMGIKGQEAETMTGVNGRTVTALPHDRLREVLKRYNRLAQ